MMLRIRLPDAFRHLVPLKNAKFDLIGSENASFLAANRDWLIVIVQ